MSERWSLHDEIKDILEPGGCGPIVYREGKENYCYSGESNILINGSTGTGKTRRVMYPYAHNIINNREIGIIQDPKGEIFANTHCYAVEQGINIMAVDFRSPEKSLNKWNPLSLAWDCYHIKKAKNEAEEMLEEIVQLLTSNHSKHEDSFWVEKHENLIRGVLMLGIEYMKRDEYTLANLLAIIGEDWISLNTNSSDDTVNGGLFSDILEVLPNGSKATALRDYASLEARRTRNCAKSESTGTLTKFCKTSGIVNLTSGDDLNILNINAEKPFLLYIITPDDSPIYDDFSALLVSTLFRHLIKIADTKYGGKLRTRVHVLLDELGNCGRTLTSLPHLLSAGRSRGIRTAIVLQALSQLDTVYGASKANTILGNTDFWICFRTTDIGTCRQLSDMAGHKTIKAGDYNYTRPLISEASIMAMQTGQAIFFFRGCKYVYTLPDYLEAFDFSDCIDVTEILLPIPAKINKAKAVSLLEIKKRIVESKKSRIIENKKLPTTKSRYKTIFFEEDDNA